VNAKNKKICFKDYRELAQLFSVEMQTEFSVKNRYLKSKGLHPFFLEIIEIADNIIGNDFTIEWSLPFSDYENLSDFKNSFCLSFAKDDYGNSFHIYNATKENSPIIYKSHDPEVLVVVANNFCEFVHLLQKYSSESSLNVIDSWFKSEVYSRIQKITKIKEDELDGIDLRGMLIAKKKNSIQIDFSNAKVGSGISLSLFGDLTRVRRNLKTASLSLLKPSQQEIEKHRREKIQTRLALVSIPSIFFVLFLFKALSNQWPMHVSFFLVPFLTIIGSVGVLCLYGILYSIYLKLSK